MFFRFDIQRSVSSIVGYRRGDSIPETAFASRAKTIVLECFALEMQEGAIYKEDIFCNCPFSILSVGCRAFWGEAFQYNTFLL
ncbi:MAG: hypothetical protein F6J93_20670 [Oscillatoria sp. SIO1A7]|nr:hypothetical protein [Oscillatoria sp. SIO1A7]